jgi:hypothetical protein
MLYSVDSLLGNDLKVNSYTIVIVKQLFVNSCGFYAASHK